MSEEWFAAPGEQIQSAALRIPKACQLAKFVSSGAHGGARLLETRYTTVPERAETIVLELDVEVGQQPIHDIRPVERIAVTFLESDRYWPEVLALRVDFPADVPHLFPRADDEPRSLCLYEDSYGELKLRWTAVKVVERIRFWLRETSRGTLHGSDQPLEPVFTGRYESLVLPPEIFSGGVDAPERLSVYCYDRDLQLNVYVATHGEGAPGAKIGEFVATVLVAPPSTQRAIRFAPHNLLELDTASQATGLDLVGEVRKRLLDWQLNAQLLGSRLVLVVAYPKIRGAASSVEASDIWAFGMVEPVSRLGELLGLWQTIGPGVVGGLVGVAFEKKRARDVALRPLNPYFKLSRAMAASANGTVADARRILAIGVGALGSQIVGSLIRSGYGQWRFVDQDTFFPHNAARHELPHAMVGRAKARAMTEWANSILAERVAEEEVVADVLQPGAHAEALAAAFRGADVVADFSASQEAARYLARDIQCDARRVSAFLNPTGTDVVVLAEDSLRKIPIDAVEMQYYRMLLNQSGLENHFREPAGRIRTARSCRDLSTVLSGDLVSHHAAVASRGIRTALEEDTASIAVWTTDAEFNTRVFREKVVSVAEREVGAWRLVTDDSFLSTVRGERRRKLPLETGGVLLGSWDLVRGIVYVVASISAPEDSEEWPTSYIRGSRGLEAAVRRATMRTGSQLQYIGEWHSHPDGHTAEPSEDDRKLFAWLQDYTRQDGYSPVMLIVGELELCWFVGHV
jgi:integrative and conjugative element protein (TIGR02256 family)